MAGDRLDSLPSPPVAFEAFGERDYRRFWTTQFISNVIFKKPLQLVDGGKQSRSFTFIDDGVDALLRIIENKSGCASRRIFNLGNPRTEVSVAALAKLIIAAFKEFPDYQEHAAKAKTVVVPSGKYFGKYYQDIHKRVPSIAQAKQHLGWTPKVNLTRAIKLTLDYHLTHKDYRLE